MTAPHQQSLSTIDELLGDYTAGDVFFAAGGRAVLGSGSEHVLTDTDPTRVAEAADAVLSASSTSLGFGVLPFDTTATPTRFVVPKTVRTTRSAGANRTRTKLGAPVASRSLPQSQRHRETVARAVHELRDRRLAKVVLARALDLEFDEPIAAGALLANLLRDNEFGYTFASELPNGSTLIGASPELLLSRRGKQVFSHPHAGSAPRSDDPAVDKANGESLLRSAKDQVEHRAVSEMVADTLRPFCRKLDVPPEPSLVSTPTMWHLGTTVTGELRDSDITALRLAAALHPTPATCGTPSAAAMSLIGELEPFDRGYYGGAIGWMDATGDGEWAVTIRCAEMMERSMRLYAGGGIVADSDPDAELAETTAKFRTLLRAVGLEREP